MGWKRTASWSATALLVSVSASVGAPVTNLANGNWPQWRGPEGRGVVEDPAVPLRWSEEENILWKTEIEGRGHSSPVVWGKRIFLTTAIEGEVIPGAEAPIHFIDGQEFKHPDSVGSDRRHTMKVLALDADSGEIVWSRVAYDGRVFDDRHKESSYASPTPATDGERVYAYFGSQGVYAYDFDGEPVWKRDIGQISTLGMGVGTSPVLYGDLLIIQADSGEAGKSFIVALDKKTGEERWKTSRPVQAGFSTPLLVEDDSGHSQLVTSGTELLISYDPETGRELWRTKGLKSNAVHTPLAGDGLVVHTSGYPSKVIVAVSLERDPSLGEDERILWRYNKGTAYVPSNLLYDGRVYLTNDGGVLTCLDAGTGEVVYEGGRFPERTRFMSSPIVVDGKILMIGLEGDAAFLQTGPKHEVLAQSSIDERVYAAPAVANGRLYIRGERHLFAIAAPE